ncbi:unnamed protein product [Peniophora sp. CBMAI 1063]|nr:unnamed protein product [Peniophora sp. CBMAI 1063]
MLFSLIILPNPVALHPASRHASVLGETLVERPQYVKADFNLSKTLAQTVLVAHDRLDRLADSAETGQDTPSTLSSVSGGATPDYSLQHAHHGLDTTTLAAQLQGLQTTQATDESTAASDVVSSAEATRRRTSASSLPGSILGRGRPEPVVPLVPLLGKRRRSPSPEKTAPKKMSRNAKKKATQALKVARGEGDWLPRARKLQGPIEQSASHQRRHKRRRLDLDRLETQPWSAKARGTFFGRDRPLRIVLLDEEQEVKLSISTSRGAYVGSYGTDWAAGCAGSEDRAIRAGLKKAHWDATHTLLILDENEVINVAFVPPPKRATPITKSTTTPKPELQSPLQDCPAQGIPSSGLAYEASVSFDQMCRELVALFGEADELDVPAQAKHGRRGDFVALNFGLQSGMGQVPHELRPPTGCEDYIRKLKGSEHMQRLATWQSEIFAYWAPLAHRHVRCQLKALHEKTGLRPPFPRSVYPTACANCGPHTVCKAHRDKTNYPSCPCCVTALGNFKSEEGGHMVLPDIGIYVPFPPGASCLLSSAAMTHGNLSIQPGETRYSFTQYCVGGLMRAVAYDMKLAKNLSDEERARMDEEAGEGWNAQYARFSKVWEVDEDRAWVREQDRLELLAEEEVEA